MSGGYQYRYRFGLPPVQPASLVPTLTAPAARNHACAAASPIDVEDPKWAVYGAYEVVAEGYHFVGYATTYRFSNPFSQDARASGRTDILRLAQLLILPVHQRAGHGERFLTAITTDGEAADIAELTVEAPCDGMRALRDVFDVRAAVAAQVFGGRPGWTPGGLPLPSASPSLMCDLSNGEVTAVRARLRITRGQVHRTYEALLLAAVPTEPTDGGDVGRAYRLMVKRRLWNDDEELRAVTDVDTRKALLEDMFQGVRREYAATLAKLASAGGIGPLLAAAPA